MEKMEFTFDKAGFWAIYFIDLGFNWRRFGLENFGTVLGRMGRHLREISWGMVRRMHYKGTFFPTQQPVTLI
jgi:hypothetical protein